MDFDVARLRQDSGSMIYEEEMVIEQVHREERSYQGTIYFGGSL